MEPFEHPSVTVAPALAREAIIESRSQQKGERQAAVRVDASGIFIDGELAIARADVELARVAFGELASVVVTPRAPSPSKRFGFSRPLEARRMLESLGFDYARTPASFRFTPQLDLAGLAAWRTGRWVLAAVAASVLVTVAAVELLGLRALGFLVVLPLVAFSLLGSSTRAEVGIDGVRTQSLGVNRFYAYADIERVTQDGEALTLTLRSGVRVVLSVSAPEHIAAVAARIEDGIATLAATPKATEAPALRERVTEAAHVSELRRLGSADGDYRTARIGRDQLWEVVEDPANDAAVRANAAAALSGRLDDADRQRLRVAASATASPKVRVAIEMAASSATDEALAEALAEIEHSGT